MKVDARNTTKECSKCKNKVEMSLSKRIFSCDNCGLKIDRDVNAALNIYSRAGQAQTNTPADRLASISKNVLKEISKLDESGTICIKNNLDSCN